MADAHTMTITTEGTLILADDEAGLVDGTAYSCQVTSSALTPSPNLTDRPATFCSPAAQVPAATSWTLDITWLQDWDVVPPDSLSFYAYENDTVEKWFELRPSSATEPSATGVVRIVAGAYLGEAGTPLTATASWPCQGKPVITAPTAVQAQDADEIPDPEPVEV